MNAQPESGYRALVAAGDDPDAPERVRVDHRGDRAVVTLDESERLNVLSAPLVRQLRRTLQALDADADIRTVVLTGADPGFSAGGDLRMMQVAVEQLGGARPGEVGLGEIQVLQALEVGLHVARAGEVGLDLQQQVVLKVFHHAHTPQAQDVLGEGRALARVRSPYVARARPAESHEGGDGVTVVQVRG